MRRNGGNANVRLTLYGWSIAQLLTEVTLKIVDATYITVTYTGPVVVLSRVVLNSVQPLAPLAMCYL
jgi:hypothetical protein